MKLKYLSFAALLIFMAACEDEELPSQSSTGEAEIVVDEVTTSLVAQGNLTTFIDAFEGLEMSDAEVENGITIFAPVDAAMEGDGYISSQQSRVAAGAAEVELTAEVLKNHIVKGIIKASELSDGEKLTTLGGIELEVTIDGDDVFVNGVMISGKDVSTGEKHVVHTVEKLLTEDATPVEMATIVVTVWNGVKWGPEKPNGEVEAGAMVYLYNSQEDYATGEEAAFTMETDTEGKATFADLEPEKTYYIVAKKDDLSNIFHKSEQTENGVFTGMIPNGLFQNQAEVDDYAMQSDAKPGNFKWKDLNADFVVNESDRGAIPHLEVESVSSETTEVEVIIGYEDNYEMGPVKSQQMALDMMVQSYKELDKWHKTMVMVDGMLSDDADCGEMTSWCDIDNFTFNSQNPKFAMLWHDGYKIVGHLNKVLRDVPELEFNESAEVIAQAKGIRAYIYFNLMVYFGNIPLQTGVDLPEDIILSSTEETTSFVLEDLSSAVDALPVEWASDKSYQLTSGAAKALMAKVYLWSGEYQKVAEYTNAILQSATYELMSTEEAIFEDATNAEIMWDFTFNLSSEFSTYFYDRSFCPAIRLAEVYLMDAEAKFMLGMTQDGVMSLNVLRDRMELASATSASELTTTWQAEMSREGSRFANLVRWDYTANVLGNNGFSFQHSLLPIPQVFIESHFNFVQNPGY